MGAPPAGNHRMSTEDTTANGRTVAFETLGCKLNQYETESIATAVAHRGYTVVPLEHHADAYVINTCTVTNRADRKSRNTINRALRMGNPEAPVIVTGCFVNNHHHTAVQETATPPASSPAEPSPLGAPAGASVRYWVDNARKHAIPEILDAHFRGETVDPHTLGEDLFGFSTPERVFHTRTNIKVQDGCDNFCTFCIIPFVRGRAVSRPVDDVLREAREALESGSGELVLTGVNMSRYHHPQGDFADLVHRLLELPGDYRVRISSLEPDHLDERFIELFHHRRMCPHLHLCLQSGSDRILLRMRRMYTRRSYAAVVEALRRVDPLFNITTDIITGFPGETAEDFDHTLSAIREFSFGHVHVFPYSRRSGTRASRENDSLPPGLRKARTEEVLRHSEREKARYRWRFAGTTQRVLVERQSGSTAYGLGQHYVPVSLECHSTPATNTFVEATVTGCTSAADQFTLTGTCRV